MALTRSVVVLSFTAGDGLTRYTSIGDSDVTVLSTVDGAQTIFDDAGVLNNLSIVVNVNATTSNSTFVSNINGVDGNLTITIPAGQTGTFRDLANSDTISAGDKVCWKLVNGGGGDITVDVASVEFLASSGTSKSFSTGTLVVYDSASTTKYAPFVGKLAFITTEPEVQYKARFSGTLSRLYIYVGTNNRTTDTVLRLRKNGSNGNMVITIGAGQTGYFQDTTNTDTIVSGDLINLSFTTLSGGEIIVPYIIGLTENSDDGKFSTIAIQPSGTTITAGATTYSLVGSDISSFTTESDAQTEVITGFLTSRLRVHVSQNSLTTSTTVTFRIDGQDGNQTFAIGAGATGYFEDESNTDNVPAGSLISVKTVAGTGGTIQFSALTLTATETVIASGGNINPLYLRSLQ